MSFKKFIKDKILLSCLLLFAIATIEIFLIAYPVGIFLKIYIPVILIALYLIAIVIEYLKKNSYYKNLLDNLDRLDEKYLITELINTPSFADGEILKDILSQANKSMIENVNKYKYMR